MQRIAYLPIEFAARELDSKSLIAAELCRRGWVVLIGQQWKMHRLIEKLPKGVFLFKGYHKTYWPAFIAAKKAGHYVTVMEEELFNTDSKDGISPLVSPGLGRLVDLVFTQSEMELDLLAQVGGVTTTRRSGNPRADLLKPFFSEFWAQKIEQIRESYGDYILVNTNFGLTNSGWGSFEIARKAAIQSGVLREDDPKSVSFFEAALSYEKYCKKVMLESIEIISGCFDKTIVVRPHPGESLEFWQREARKYKNVFVEREGAHVPWTLGSDVLLHGGCTTGFESWIGKKPSITICNSENPYAQSLLANRVSLRCASSKDVLCAIKMLYDGKPPQVREMDHVGMFGLSEDSRNYLKIADALDSVVTGLNSRGAAWEAVKELVRNERSKEVIQLEQKCSIDSSTWKQCLARISNQLSSVELFGQKVGESLYLMRKADAEVYYHESPCHVEFDSREATEKLLIIANGGNRKALDYFVSQNRDSLRRNPSFFLAMAQWSTLMGESDLVEEYLCQTVVIAEHIDGVMQRALRIAKSAQLDSYVKALGFRNYAKSGGFASLDSLILSRPNAKRILVVGDSHVRAFRVARLLRAADDFLKRHVDVIEIGGGSAYGLANDDSKSGAHAKIRALLPSMGKYDACVWHFGEIDCRRSAWRAAEKLGTPIEDQIRSSVLEYRNFVRHVSEKTPGVLHVIVCPKWPLVSSEVMVEISKFDERSFGVSLEERFRITKLFENFASDLFGEMGFWVIPFSDSECVSNLDIERYNMIALRGCLEDDVHGSMRFFSKAATVTLDSIALKLGGGG